MHEKYSKRVVLEWKRVVFEKVETNSAYFGIISAPQKEWRTGI